MAVPKGFEPSISGVTGRHVKPLHHGTAFGDPSGTRTRVASVKGWCVNRFTMGPRSILHFNILQYEVVFVKSAARFTDHSRCKIDLAIKTPAADACAKPRVTPAPSPPAKRPAISVSNSELRATREE